MKNIKLNKSYRKMIKSKENNKKAQHEIMGFVIIVALVMIIGVVFLGLMIRPTSTKHANVEISNLLQASMYSTTNCSISWPGYKNGQELVKSCFKNERCLDGRMACEALNSTLKNIISQSLKISEDTPNKAYKLSIYYLPSGSDEKDYFIPEIKKGLFEGCNSIIGGNHKIEISSIGSGTIFLELDVCRG